MSPGDILAGRFELIALRASGGMGEVWRARDRTSSEDVAVKIVTNAGAGGRERFRVEADLLATMHHPGIVRYVAHGSTPDGIAYLAMEWLEGEDLCERLARGPISPDESIELATRVADALAAAHARGIVHRDIKPENLFLPDGDLTRVKILDFGIARLRNGIERVTLAGAIVGTPGYMSPEQARGDVDVGVRTDVFALGCVLYECLTGHALFAAEHTMAVLAKVLFEEGPPPSRLVPGLSPRIDELIASMTAKDAARRPADATDTAARLRALRSAARPSRASMARIAATVLSDTEWRLVSVVFVPDRSAASDPAWFGRTIADDDAVVEASLRSALAPYGAQLDTLAGGGLVAVLHGRGNAMDQAAQAARCALELSRRLGHPPMTLATGRGHVASGIPLGEAIDRAVRTAKRDRAGSPHVRIDEMTAALLDERFVRSADEISLVVLRERPRGESSHTLLGKSTPCVGRERELSLLGGLAGECAADSVARVALLTGEAGIGKSRLRDEFVRALRSRDDGTRIWTASGDPMRAGSPFALLADVIAREAGTQEGEPVRARRQKLRARVMRHLSGDDVDRVTEFLAELLAIDADDSASVQYRAAKADAMTMGDQLRRAFEDFLAAELSVAPVAIVLDDLQWGDLPSLAALDASLRNLAEKPLLVVAFGRADVDTLFPKLWSERRPQRVELGPLSRRAAERLVRDVLGDRADDDVVARIVTRAGGNALYLEELLRAVAERRGGELPASVIAMAQARLETLEPQARRVLRAASIFGQTFWLGGVTTLVVGDEAEESVATWLDAMRDAEIVVESSTGRFPGEREWSFRSEILREAAYATLTDADRALGHRLAAEWLENAGERDAVSLAQHFERGGERGRAAAWFLNAAREALEGNDFASAFTRIERGLACDPPESLRGALLLARAEAHSWRGEAAAARDASALAAKHLPVGSASWFAATGELAAVAGRLGDRTLLFEVIETLLAAEPSRDAGERQVTAYARAGINALYAGRGDVGRRVVDRIAPIAESLGSQSPLVAAWYSNLLANVALFEGETEENLRVCLQAMEHFDRAGDIRRTINAATLAANACNHLGLFERTREVLEPRLALAERIGLPYVAAMIRQNLAFALARLGDLPAAIEMERRSVDALAEQGARRMEGGSRTYLARLLLQAGEVDEAVRVAHDAVTRLAESPTLVGYARAVLTLALLESGAVSEARAAAEPIRGTLDTGAQIEEGEALMRLAVVRALLASGDETAARIEVTKAFEHIESHAARLRDESVRRAFTTRLPENAETVAIAKQLGVA